MPIKCPRCKGCGIYIHIDNKTHIKCDFCKKYYHIKPGGSYEMSELSWDIGEDNSVQRNVPDV